MKYAQEPWNKVRLNPYIHEEVLLQCENYLTSVLGSTPQILSHSAMKKAGEWSLGMSLGITHVIASHYGLDCGLDRRLDCGLDCRLDCRPDCELKIFSGVITVASQRLVIPHTRHPCHRVGQFVLLSPDRFSWRANRGLGMKLGKWQSLRKQ